MAGKTTILAIFFDDIILNIFNKLESNPRDWASLACTCKKFSWLIHNVCWKKKCLKDISSDLTSGGELPGGWYSLYKIAVGCPGLIHSGIRSPLSRLNPDEPSSSQPREKKIKICPEICRSLRLHLASGVVWELSREQGSKLLDNGFTDDSLYISEWPGCVHLDKKHGYMLFRGIFKDFKGSQVWKNIVDGKRSAVDLSCAYCTCKETWDLHSIFCLRRGFGYPEDGDPSVRAFVCENGHVSGAWTHLPLYT